MTLVHNEYDEICPVCNFPLGAEELEAGVDVHSECYWRVMDEYDKEMAKDDNEGVILRDGPRPTSSILKR